MSKVPAIEEPNPVPAQPVNQDGRQQAAERRRFEDGLEDDEVREALAALHTDKQD
jgi:hypothetical protein